MIRIAIIGSGPTGIYTLKGLVGSAVPISITVFEAESDPGKGTPYHPDINDRAMLSNIASIELPVICETLVQWLRRQTNADLQRLLVNRDAINEREFYPRVVLGEFLQAQFIRLVATGQHNGHVIDVRARQRVVDIALQTDDIRVTVQHPDGSRAEFAFDHVVMATGHDWPENIEVKPGYFVSPWPAHALKQIGNCPVGILGTSLSGIDALITVATAHGAFYLDAAGQLQFHASAHNENFHVTMMSRKGLLPEADFYCEIPYVPPLFCTNEAIDALLATGRHDLLDEIFELFKQELMAADPDYAAKIGLSMLTVETVASAYFAARERIDPFVWAAQNLAEAEQNKANRYTVQWRYAIIRMHEVIARAIPQLDETDLGRFHKHFKTVFVDDYATVPHASIARLLALHRAGILDIVALGADYTISADGVERGVVLTHQGETARYEAFIDATGQHAMSAVDIPFPTLIEQGVVRKATTPQAQSVIGSEIAERTVRTGGIDLDAAFRPKFEDNLCNHLYCAAISFLLHKLPFVQGITSAHDIGVVVSAAILSDIEQANAGRFQMSA
ncbi:FAD/NAD(P)-binding protein [Rhizobium sp. PL01]|uniref:FAD/NAD(P)-binding protein n=1 Tax=Rhizobium sp. PL01 TaxID=3085631 RepID=UPI002980D362|nr:FAD/NAD(P)-binding protein [Rhizobium sp. PL01]MDW5317178.1 FAD/NAD(P)-binding protein [Rhizobium sp. PL01]